MEKNKTKTGCWGLICSECFKIHGYGLGVGLGQKYDFKTKEQIKNIKEENKMSESFVMEARIRKATEFNIAKDFVAGLSSKVVEMLRASEESAKVNGRKTLQVSDLPAFEEVKVVDKLVANPEIKKEA